MLNYRQLGRFTLTNQRTFGYQSPPDAPGDRCCHGGVTEIDTRCLNVCPADRDISLGLLLRGHRVGILLLADGIGFDQRLVAVYKRGCLGYIGFGPRLACAGTRHGCGVGRSVNHKQGLADLHIAAFSEKSSLQNASRSGTNLGYS